MAWVVKNGRIILTYAVLADGVKQMKNQKKNLLVSLYRSLLNNSFELCSKGEFVVNQVAGYCEKKVVKKSSSKIIVVTALYLEPYRTVGYGTYLYCSRSILSGTVQYLYEQGGLPVVSRSVFSMSRDKIK